MNFETHPPRLERPKLAEQIARQLEDRIVAEGWEPGTPLGSEAELVADAGVSRWTFREAIRILEQEGLVVSRRGGGGGIFVGGSVGDFVCNQLAHYIEFLQADAGDIAAVWSRLDLLLVKRATANLTDLSRKNLQVLAQRATCAPIAEALHLTDLIRSELAEAAENPAAALFVKACSRLATHATWYSSLADEDFHALFPRIVASAARLAGAVARSAPEEVAAESKAYVELCVKLLEASHVTGGPRGDPRAIERAYELFPRGRPSRKADQVVTELRDRILGAGWPVGSNMGVEPQLMAEFGVGRAVLREAIRSLEWLGVVRMARGGSSGLTVIAPDPERVVATCRRHLRRAGATADHAALVRKSLREDGGGTHSGGGLVPLFERILETPAD